jgi:hypothetical protein
MIWSPCSTSWAPDDVPGWSQLLPPARPGSPNPLITVPALRLTLVSTTCLSIALRRYRRSELKERIEENRVPPGAPVVLAQLPLRLVFGAPAPDGGWPGRVIGAPISELL